MAYALPGQRIRMEECKNSSQRLAFLGAVSSETGMMPYITKVGFFKSEDVVEFLKLMREHKPQGKLAIFWDNCATHTSGAVIDAA